MSNKPLTVLFGSMTGNAEDLAERTADRAKEEGYEVKFESLDDYSPDSLADDQRVVIVIATWGEGDPPDECEDFCFALYDGKTPDISHLEFCVLALGDSSYDDFCGCGRKVDEAFEKQGAKRFMERKELDVDFDDDYDEWADKFFDTLKSLG